MADQQWFSIAEVATALQVGEPTVQLLIERGLLQAEQHNDELRISEEALIEFRRADQQMLDEGNQPSDMAVLPPTDL